MKKDGVTNIIQKLQTRDLVMRQFGLAKDLTSSYLIALGIHNLNCTKIIIILNRTKLRMRFYSKEMNYKPENY